MGNRMSTAASDDQLEVEAAHASNDQVENEVARADNNPWADAATDDGLFATNLGQDRNANWAADENPWPEQTDNSDEHLCPNCSQRINITGHNCSGEEELAPHEEIAPEPQNSAEDAWLVEQPQDEEEFFFEEQTGQEQQNEYWTGTAAPWSESDDDTAPPSSNLSTARSDRTQGNSGNDSQRTAVDHCDCCRHNRHRHGRRNRDNNSSASGSATSTRFSSSSRQTSWSSERTYVNSQSNRVPQMDRYREPPNHSLYNNPPRPAYAGVPTPEQIGCPFPNTCTRHRHLLYPQYPSALGPHPSFYNRQQHLPPSRRHPASLYSSWSHFMGANRAAQALNLSDSHRSRSSRGSTYGFNPSDYQARLLAETMAYNARYPHNGQGGAYSGNPQYPSARYSNLRVGDPYPDPYYDRPAHRRR